MKCSLTFSVIYTIISHYVAKAFQTKVLGFLSQPRKPLSSARPMIFDNFFSSLGLGGGGLYGTGIDYSMLPYPCNELSSAALDGTVLEDLERNGKQLKLASFAGGCFWGLELAYQRVPGVEYTAVGYQQGLEPQPTYEQVCAGATGHTETLFVIYDPRNCSYESLLDTFFDRVDPITVNGQGRDFGRQYRTGVYFHSLKQEQVARDRLIVEQKKIGNRRKIATECIAAMPFWPAEKYHQQYLERGGQFSSPQCAEKGCLDEIRCYG